MGSLIVAALCVQSIGMLAVNKYSDGWWKSALITSLGLCLLCKTGSLQTTLLKPRLPLDQSSLFDFAASTFLTVNFGLIATSLITQDSWVSPGQWKSSRPFACAGCSGLYCIGQGSALGCTLTFFIVFGGLMYANIVWYKGWDFSVFLHSITSGTLVLFTFYMITDPMTTPNHRTRILWIGLVSLFFCSGNSILFHSARVLFFMSPWFHLSIGIGRPQSMYGRLNPGIHS